MTPKDPAPSQGWVAITLGLTFIAGVGFSIGLIASSTVWGVVSIAALACAYLASGRISGGRGRNDR